MGKHVDATRPSRHKHEDFPTATTRIKEHQAEALAKIGQNYPGFGKHRANENDDTATEEPA